MKFTENKRKVCFKKHYLFITKYLKLISLIIALFFLSSNLKAICNPLKKDYITVIIQYKEAKPLDTLTIVFGDVLHNQPERYNLGHWDAVGHNGVFRFTLPIHQSCGYFDIIKNRTFTKGITDKFIMKSSCFWEKGDSILISLTNRETYAGIYSKCSYSGRGANKYTLNDAADSIMYSEVNRTPKPIFDSTFRYSDPYLIRCSNTLKFLENNKDSITNLSYQVIKANILYGNPSARFQTILEYYNKNVKGVSIGDKSKFRERFNEQFWNDNEYGFSEAALSNSKNYLFYCFFKYRTQSLIINDTIDQKSIFDTLIKKFKGVILDKEILLLFLRSKASPITFELYSEAQHFVHDETSSKILAELINSGIGKPFTDFSLEDVNRKLVKIADFKGKAILIDLWFNGCGGCAVFYQNTLKKIEQDFKGDDKIVFISINGDNHKSRWLEGIKRGLYTSPDAINIYTNGQGAEHAIVKSNNITSFPFVFLIDKNGIVRYSNSDDLYSPKGLAAAIRNVEN